MSINDQASPNDGFLRILRDVSLFLVIAGAAGSVALILRAGQRTPLFLLILFIIWVLSPFAGLLWTNVVSKRWSFLTRVALYCVTLIVTLGSLAMYSELIVVRPVGSANAFVWVVVPPVTWGLTTIIMALVAFLSRRLSKNAGAG